ncbi:MAG: hypothetical protein ACTSPL_08420 [Candidatus Odinarchaeia archaeon]
MKRKIARNKRYHTLSNPTREGLQADEYYFGRYEKITDTEEAFKFYPLPVYRLPNGGFEVYTEDIDFNLALERRLIATFFDEQWTEKQQNKSFNTCYGLSQKSVTINNISNPSMRTIVQNIGHSTKVVCQNVQTQYRFS